MGLMIAFNIVCISNPRMAGIVLIAALLGPLLALLWLFAHLFEIKYLDFISEGEKDDEC